MAGEHGRAALLQMGGQARGKPVAAFGVEGIEGFIEDPERRAVGQRQACQMHALFLSLRERACGYGVALMQTHCSECGPGLFRSDRAPGE